MLQHLSSDTKLGSLQAEQGENTQPLLWPLPAGGPAQLMHHIQSSGRPVPSLTPGRSESLPPIRKDTDQEIKYKKGLEISLRTHAAMFQSLITESKCNESKFTLQGTSSHLLTTNPDSINSEVTNEY